MASIGLIMTTDYEIFGNGTGCVEKCMIEPTERMAALLEEAGARLTIFFDVCEYWAFQDEFEKGTLRQDWPGMIQNQLQDLLRRGHDVQLHFHPQWLDYSYDGQTWQLNYGLWRIGSLKYRDEEHPERGLKNLFTRGKRCLEEMLIPVKPDYRCEIFRAGAWSIQPEHDVLRAMIDNGFQMDSTVAPGLKFRDDHTFYDFTGAPKSFVYPVKDSVLKNEKGDLWEVPIFTTKMSWLQKLYFAGLKRKKSIPFKPEGCIGKALASSGKSKFKKIRELLSQSVSMFTFGDAASFEEMRFYAKSAIGRAKNSTREREPVVAISHPKSFANDRELEKFLKWCTNQKEIDLIGYDDFKKQVF